MFRSTSILPLKGDPSNRYLPWITAFMVYLAALALGGVLAIDQAAQRWEEGGVDRITVQYIPHQDADADHDTELLLRLLRASPGVEEARLLPRDELVALLEPWLGEGLIGEDLTLPRLIDVALAEGGRIDIETLRDRLRLEVPGAHVEDPKHWLDGLAKLARSIQWVAAALLLVIGLAAMGTVIVTTQMGLAAHREVIEVLHLIGARDAFLARQFERHSLRLGLRGGLVGLALAAATVFGLAHAARDIDAPLLPTLRFESWGWGALGALPIAIALVIMVTARITVLRSLADKP